FRVLKPGGRLAVSDIVTHGELPAQFRQSLELWAGCLSGALDDADYLRRLRAAGFAEAQISSATPLPLESLGAWAANPASDAAAAGCCTPSTLAGQTMTREMAGRVVSAQITAVKAP